jgi:hypothetical protein
MLSPIPFALHAAQACVPHAELATSLAGAFHAVDAEAVDDRIDQLAAELIGPPPDDPLEQLQAVADVLRLPVAPRPKAGDRVGPLMIDVALDERVAHPLTRAILAVDIGRRHGFEVGLVSNGAVHCVGHEQLDEPLLLRCDSAAIVDAHTIPATLQWRCSHEACALLLDELEDRWLRWNRIEEALLAAQLRLRLPLDADCAQDARVQVERVRARLN